MPHSTIFLRSYIYLFESDMKSIERGKTRNLLHIAVEDDIIRGTGMERQCCYQNVDLQ